MNKFEYYFYQFTGIMVRFFVRVFLNFRVVRMEKHIPRRSRILVVSNHQSLLDPPVIGSFIRDLKLSYFAKWELFQVPILRSVIRWLGAFPVKRGESDLEAIRTATGILTSGGCLIMFPEGTRTLDGKIKPFQKGAGFLTAKTKCHVLPVYLDGLFQLLPKKGKPRFRYPVRIFVGKLISFKEIMVSVPSERDYEAISEYLYDKVKALSVEV